MRKGYVTIPLPLLFVLSCLEQVNPHKPLKFFQVMEPSPFGRGMSDIYLDMSEK